MCHAPSAAVAPRFGTLLSPTALQAPVERSAFMSYLKGRGDAITVNHSLRDKDVFTVSSWEFGAI